MKGETKFLSSWNTSSRVGIIFTLYYELSRIRFLFWTLYHRSSRILINISQLSKLTPWVVPFVIDFGQNLPKPPWGARAWLTLLWWRVTTKCPPSNGEDFLLLLVMCPSTNGNDFLTVVVIFPFSFGLERESTSAKTTSLV